MPLKCPDTHNNIHFNPDWNVIANIDASIEQDDKTTRQDNDLKLEEVCVMVTRDELQSVPKATVNTKKREVNTHSPFYFLMHVVKLEVIFSLFLVA